MTALNLNSKLLRNLGANAYGQLITVAIQLISVPLFLHYWGVALYGEWLILSAIPTYLSLSDIGFASVAANDMTMRVAKGDKQGALEVYQSSWILISTVSVLVGSLLALIIYSISVNSLFSISHISFENTRLLLVILMLYVLVGLQGGVLSAAYRSIGKYAYSIVLSNTIRLTEWLLSIVVLFLGGGVLVIAVVKLLIRLLGFIIMWLVLHKQESVLSLGYSYASMQRIQELIKPAVAFMAFPLGLALSLQGMVLVIGMTLGSAAVVIFSAYRTLTRLLVQIVTMLNHAIWPEISAAYGAGNKELVKQLHHKSSSITFWIALFTVSALSLIGEWIIGLWTHHAFEQNKTLLLMMLATAFLNVLWQTSWVVLMATNKHQRITGVFIVFSASTLLFAMLAIQYLGINGAGMVVVMAELPILYIAINSVLKLLNERWIDYIKSMINNPLKSFSIFG